MVHDAHGGGTGGSDSVWQGTMAPTLRGSGGGNGGLPVLPDGPRGEPEVEHRRDSGRRRLRRLNLSVSFLFFIFLSVYELVV